jgi:hypothetical protein
LYHRSHLVCAWYHNSVEAHVRRGRRESKWLFLSRALPLLHVQIQGYQALMFFFLLVSRAFSRDLFRTRYPDSNSTPCRQDTPQKSPARVSCQFIRVRFSQPVRKGKILPVHSSVAAAEQRNTRPPAALAADTAPGRRSSLVVRPAAASRSPFVVAAGSNPARRRPGRLRLGSCGMEVADRRPGSKMAAAGSGTPGVRRACGTSFLFRPGFPRC